MTWPDGTTRPDGAVRCASFGVRLGGAQQRLGRDAGQVAALAADQLGFDDGDALARGVHPAGHHFTGRSCADHDGVEALGQGLLLFGGGFGLRG